MQDENILLSVPLQQLKSEHVSLRADMNVFYDMTDEIAYATGPEVIQLFTTLHEQLSEFTKKLEVHSQKEEEGLFPMMTRHLAADDTTIEEMEYEHEKAEQHLKDFLTEAEQTESPLDENTAQSITVYAVQAYDILVQHFAKEEKVLFPLADRILTIEEKQELEGLL